MIDLVIRHLVVQLNQAMRRALLAPEDLVVASPLFEPNGNAAAQAADKLLVFLINIERETTAYSPAQRTASGASRLLATAEPVHLNLLIMFAANFAATNYQEALKLISFTAAFFQSHSLLTHYNSPELDGRIEKLVIELADLNINDLSNLWGVLGGKYVPSVLYRIRMVSVGSRELLQQQDRIAQPQAGVQSSGA